MVTRGTQKGNVSMSSGVNFNNNYDAFRNVQINGVDASNKISLDGKGVCQYKKASPNPDQTKNVRAAFAEAIKYELAGKTFEKDAIYLSKKGAADRSAARKEKFFSIMKSIGKYAALTIGTIATAGIGLAAYIMQKKGEKALRDLKQVEAISSSVNTESLMKPVDDEDDDNEVSNTNDVLPSGKQEPMKSKEELRIEEAIRPGYTDDKNKLSRQEGAKLSKEISDAVTSSNDDLTQEEVARMLNRVETFKAKRTLLSEANVNAFNGKNPGKLYKNIKAYGQMLFQDPKSLKTDEAKKFVDGVWKNVLSNLKWLSAKDLNRYKKFYASSLVEKMVLIAMTSPDVQDALSAWTEELKQKELDVSKGLAHTRNKEAEQKMVNIVVFALQNALVGINNEEVAAHQYR